jgi:hypothetical protein
MKAATTHLDEIEVPTDFGPGEPLWKPIRNHFDVRAFGVNAWVARGEGDHAIVEHDESEAGHEELYFVSQGGAIFDIGGERLEAPAGSLVFIRDISVRRGAIATSPGTTIVTVGGWAQRPFEVSAWERRLLGEPQSSSE